jgi:hypothetical protein
MKFFVTKIFDSGYKPFDRIANKDSSICEGNIVSDVLIGQYIRPVEEIECNDFEYKVGELRKADLKAFRNYPIPTLIMQKLESFKKQVILYCVRHQTKKDKRQVVHGWIITNSQHELVYSMYTTLPSYPIIREMVKWLTDTTPQQIMYEEDELTLPLKEVTYGSESN